MHSVCLDTTPPIFYLNEQSKQAIYLINEFNKTRPELEVGYTFDAGCNPFIFCKKSAEKEIKKSLKEHFGESILDIMESNISMRM